MVHRKLVVGLLVILFLSAALLHGGDSLARIRQLESELDLGSLNPEGFSDLEIQILDELEEAAREALLFQSGGRLYRAAAVYFSVRPDGFICADCLEDDTIHTVERAVAAERVPLLASSSFFLTDAMGGPLDLQVEVLAGDPAEMHLFAYERLVRMTRETWGGFRAAFRRGDAPQLFFTILREPGCRFFRKYVWIVTPG